MRAETKQLSLQLIARNVTFQKETLNSFVMFMLTRIDVNFSISDRSIFV